MAIHIKLVGFGEDRPARFDSRNRLSLDIATPVAPRILLLAIHVDEAPDLILMDSETVIPQSRWDQPCLEDDTHLTLLSAIEGG